MIVLVPIAAPITVPDASLNSAHLARGRRPCASSRPARSLTPISVPTVSNTSRNRKVRITVRAPFALNRPPKSSFSSDWPGARLA